MPDPLDPNSGSLLPKSPPDQVSQPDTLQRGDLMSQGLQLLEACLSPKGAQGLMGIGLFCALISALPLLQSLANNLGGSALAWVLLLYSLGIWGGAGALRHDFTWTSRSLLALVLGALPLNYLALASLDPTLMINRWLYLPALLLLPLMAWRSLKVLRPDHHDPHYLLSLVGLGCCSTFLPGLAIPLMARGYEPNLYVLFELGLSTALLAYGCWRVLRQIWLDKHDDNLKASLFLSALLIYAWVAGVSLYALPSMMAGMVLLVPALMLTMLSLRLRQVCRLMQTEFKLPQSWQLSYQLSEALAAVMALIAAVLGWEHYLLPALAAGLLLWLASLQAFPAGLAMGSFSFGCLSLGVYQVTQHQWADSAALVLAATAVILGMLARLQLTFELSERQQRVWLRMCQAQALLLCCASVWQMMLFQNGSILIGVALIFLTIYGVCHALWLDQSIAGYASIATGLTAVIYAVLLYEPVLSLEGWRWLALGLSFMMLAAGWLVERLSPGHQALVSVARPLADQKLLVRLFKRELPDPYRFRQRFVSSVPYLFAEPLYNLALLLLTGTWLVNLGELSFSAAAAVFYLLVFAIYPSRLWLYLVLLSLSDGLIGAIYQLLPGRYQSWGLVLVGMSWFFAGMLIEELLAARDRRLPHQEYEAQKQLVKPFFHAALAANALMLGQVFGELQIAAGNESWESAASQALPMLITSGLYLLKLRVWVSRLWFYPGMLTVTLGLYFGMGGLLPLEGHLLLLTLIAWVWAATGRLWLQNDSLQSWWRELAEFRLGTKAQDSAYIKAHLARPESPFFTLSLLAAGVSLSFSLLLIPAQLLNWEQAMPLSFLTLSRPEWLDGFQLLNLVLLSLFFGLALPGSPRTRAVYDSTVLLSLSAALLWAVRNQLNLDTLPIALLLLALGWQLLGLFTQQLLRQSLQRCLQISAPLFAVTGAAALLLGQSAWYDILGLGLLAILCAVNLYQRPSSWQVHGLNLCCLFGIYLTTFHVERIAPFGYPDPLMIPLGMCLASLALLTLRWRLPVLAPSLQGWSAFYLVLNSLFLLIMVHSFVSMYRYAGFHQEELNLLMMFALPWLVHLAWQARYTTVLIPIVPFTGLLVLSLGLFYSPWLAPLVFTLLGPALAASSRLSETAAWRRPLRVALLMAPVLLQIPILILPPAFTPGLTVLWQSLHLLAGSGIYAWLALRQPRYLWGAVLIADLAWEWAFWQGLGLNLDRSAGALMLQVHATLLPLALSFLLLAQKLIKRQTEQDQLTYLGLSLLLLMPLSLLAIKGSGLPKALLLFELGVQVLLILLLALRLKRKALLYTGLSVWLCLALGLIGGVLLHGSPWMRWALCLVLGLGLAGVGQYVQQRQDGLRWLLRHWRSTQQNWR